eukprot:gnl/TRDRNA2_/TRDRNA2_172160_c0_seq2.p1 gnl/TRDRNA2_/TRDRNA2_172160_c0~~gnl/TRDRNA2_/TRDRNA2_172160_c0_seq2.p1  ORF type:complete len:152 (-),score=15.96 gnl/TRDRNA2_/TRDRNA2_172160_c0_seq2:239-634(-)
MSPNAYESLRDNVVRSFNASFTRLFYVLNLTSANITQSHFQFSRQVSLQDVMPAVNAVGDHLVASIDIEEACCWPKLALGRAYSDCFFDQLSCAAQFAGKQQCLSNIRQHEQRQNISFDWIFFTRPDLIWQ